jgi:hypothetical protein
MPNSKRSNASVRSMGKMVERTTQTRVFRLNQAIFLVKKQPYLAENQGKLRNAERRFRKCRTLNARKRRTRVFDPAFAFAYPPLADSESGVKT